MKLSTTAAKQPLALAQFLTLNFCVSTEQQDSLHNDPTDTHSLLPIMISRYPQHAAQEQVPSFQAHPFSLAHFKILRFPLRAALSKDSLQGLPFTLAHSTIQIVHYLQLASTCFHPKDIHFLWPISILQNGPF